MIVCMKDKDMLFMRTLTTLDVKIYVKNNIKVNSISFIILDVLLFWHNIYVLYCTLLTVSFYISDSMQGCKKL